MKRLLISGFIAVALLAIMTTMRSFSISREQYAVTTGAVSWKKPTPPTLPGALPVEKSEDKSLILSSPVKR